MLVHMDPYWSYELAHELGTRPDPPSGQPSAAGGHDVCDSSALPEVANCKFAFPEWKVGDVNLASFS